MPEVLADVMRFYRSQKSSTNLRHASLIRKAPSFVVSFAMGLLPSPAIVKAAIASSRVAAVPFVTPGVAGTIAATDQNHRSSGAVLAEASS
jgi:hypothetical protein